LRRSALGLRIPLSSALGTARAYAVTPLAGSGSFGRVAFSLRAGAAIVSFFVRGFALSAPVLPSGATKRYSSGALRRADLALIHGFDLLGAESTFPLNPGLRVLTITSPLARETGFAVNSRIPSAGETPCPVGGGAVPGGGVPLGPELEHRQMPHPGSRGELASPHGRAAACRAALHGVSMLRRREGANWAATRKLAHRAVPTSALRRRTFAPLRCRLLDRGRHAVVPAERAAAQQPSRSLSRGVRVARDARAPRLLPPRSLKAAPATSSPEGCSGRLPSSRPAVA